jgi:hypothetical protein
MKNANTNAHAINSKQRSAPRVDLLPFDFGWVAAFIRERDKAWERGALAQGVEIKPPPFPDDLRPQLGAQRIFTAADVAELLARGLARRDEDWRHWIADSHERATNPTGPALVGSSQFFGDYLTGGSNDQA